MQHIMFGSGLDKLKVAIAIKTSALNQAKLRRYYIEPNTSLTPDNFVAFDLEYNNPKKCKAATAKTYIQELLPELDNLGIKTMLLADAIYFRYLTMNQKAEPFYGHICPCTVEGYEHINVVLIPNYQAMMYNPNLQEKIDRALEALNTHLDGTYKVPGKDIIHTAVYPYTVDDIEHILESLHQYPELVGDIETKSLEFWNAGLSTIAFAWDRHNGIAFGVDRRADKLIEEEPGWIADWREPEERDAIRKLLFNFLVQYEGKITWHNGCGYDMKVLIYELWMEHLADYKNMIDGIKVMTKNFDDTKLIAYMATNNAVQNILGLKPLSAEFTGNYAEDIKDTTKIPFNNLLEYNVKDVLATVWVKEKYEPIMDKDQQRELYEGLFKDTVVTLIQTELCGMPIVPKKVQEAKAILTKLQQESLSFFKNSTIIQTFHKEQLIIAADKKTMEAEAKKKTDRATKIYKPTDSVVYYDFNPGSDTQMRKLLYEYMKYPVLDLTKGKQASCSGKTIAKLMLQARNDTDKQMFKMLKQLADVDILLSNFIPKFENAQQLPDGSWRLYGNFNLGGTQSLRLSSSGPNLQNLPSGSKYAKIIKMCFEAPTGWLFVGTDADALEDKTGALLTKDPARLKIYTEGFCGHCLRTQYYWPHKMPEIDPTSITSVNSIADLYPDERQESKAPSFALQYSGTYITLMKNCGFSEKEAKSIEANYHKLYKVSDDWLETIIEKAKQTGYVPLAFGGRIRTPLLAKTIGKKKITFAAQSEARSAGNAFTQSYCSLTLRAMNENRKRVWESPYIYDILPSATIHDSIYQVSRDSAEIVKWINDNLIECMAWQDLPELKHDTIKMSSSLEIYWPSWASAIKLPNHATKEEIKTICIKAQENI